MTNSTPLPRPALAELDAVEAWAVQAIVAVDKAAQLLLAERQSLLATLGDVAMQRAQLVQEDSALTMRDVAAEVGAATRVSDRTVERQIGDAMHLVQVWPAVHAAYREGLIGQGHVRAIVEAGGPLASTEVSAEDRALFEERMVAEAQGTTPGRLRRFARRAADAMLSDPLTLRHRAARDDRWVSVHAADDGMATLTAYLPAVLAYGIHDRLVQGANARSGDDPRTAGQWQADAFCEALLAGIDAGGGAGAGDLATLTSVHPRVQVTIPVGVLVAGERAGDSAGDGAGGNMGSATLEGGAVIDPEQARWLAGRASSWQRLFTHPESGEVVACDSYTPTAAQRRWLLARDQTCRFPGCAAAASRADVDHTVAWADGGATEIGNLAHLCRRHHTLKHASRWAVEQPTPGVLRWTSPLGSQYIDEPFAVGPTGRAVRKRLRLAGEAPDDGEPPPF